MIKSLAALSDDEVVAVFCSAFADYAVNFSPDQVRSLLRRRGFCKALSFGAFESGRPVSFVFNGIGVYNGQPMAYDTGTGTVPEYRGRGLAADIFRVTREALRRQGIESYILEVLSDNAPAISLYRKMGFEIVREFTCHSASLSALDLGPEIVCPGLEIRPAELCNAVQTGAFHDVAPSWQNSYPSTLRAADEISCFGAWVKGEFVGYLIADLAQGEIIQLAVRDDSRRRHIASALFREFANAVTAPKVKAINIDVRCEPMIRFLESRAMPVASRQYEMTLPL